MVSSFALTCLIYVPLVVWAIVGVPDVAFKAAGQVASVSLSFAQISGSSSAMAAQLQPVVEEEPEPEVEPQPQKEELKPEPVPEPAIVKKTPPKKVAENKPKKLREKKKSDKSKKVVRAPDNKAEPAQEASANQSIAPSAAPTPTQGAPTAANQGGISTLVYGQVDDPFLAEVKRQVEAALHYPRKARAMRMQGVTTLQFIVDKDGTLKKLEVFSESGHKLLDKMALKAVVAAQTRWGQPNRTVRLRFPIQFKLTN